MVLEKGDSGVCLSATEPSSPSEASGVARPVAFFVNVGGPATGAGASGAPVRRIPTTSSASGATPAHDVDLRRTNTQPSSRSATTPRSMSGMPRRPHGDPSTSPRKTIGQKFYGALHKFSTKVHWHTCNNHSVQSGSWLVH